MLPRFPSLLHHPHRRLQSLHRRGLLRPQLLLSDATVADSLSFTAFLPCSSSFSPASTVAALRRRSHASPAIFSSSPPMLLWSPGSSAVTHLAADQPPLFGFLPPPPCLLPHLRSSPVSVFVRCHGHRLNHRDPLLLLPLPCSSVSPSVDLGLFSTVVAISTGAPQLPEPVAVAIFSDPRGSLSPSVTAVTDPEPVAVASSPTQEVLYHRVSPPSRISSSPLFLDLTTASSLPIPLHCSIPF